MFTIYQTDYQSSPKKTKQNKNIKGQLYHKKPRQEYHTHIYLALSERCTPLTNTPNPKTNVFADVLCLLAFSNNDYKRDLL